MLIFFSLFSLTLHAGIDRYHGHPELVEELQTLHTLYPLLTKLSEAGLSVEKRTLNVMTVGPTTEAALPSVFILGGIHARERISSEFPLMIAQRLLKLNASGDQRVQSILQKLRVHVLPIMNPDGVEYDRSGPTRKSWRKSRSDNGGGSFGVDLNRNFGYGWSNLGASDAPFSDIYKGKAPFSEPETRGVRDFIIAHPDIKITVNYHSFGELVMYPWGGLYTPIKDQTAMSFHRTLAEKMAKLTGYTAFQSSAGGLVTGDICDWAFGEKKIACFGVELDPKDYNDIGHYLPYEKAEGVLNRNWESILVYLEAAISKI